EAECDQDQRQRLRRNLSRDISPQRESKTEPHHGEKHHAGERNKVRNGRASANFSESTECLVQECAACPNRNQHRKQWQIAGKPGGVENSRRDPVSEKKYQDTKQARTGNSPP